MFLVDADGRLPRRQSRRISRVLALDDAIFKALGTTFEKNEFVAKADGHAATKVAQHIIYDKSEGSLWYDVDGKGGKAAVQFAQLGSEKSHPMDLDWQDFAIA